MHADCTPSGKKCTCLDFSQNCHYAKHLARHLTPIDLQKANIISSKDLFNQPPRSKGHARPFLGSIFGTIVTWYKEHCMPTFAPEPSTFCLCNSHQLAVSLCGYRPGKMSQAPQRTKQKCEYLWISSASFGIHGNKGLDWGIGFWGLPFLHL